MEEGKETPRREREVKSGKGLAWRCLGIRAVKGLEGQERSRVEEGREGIIGKGKVGHERMWGLGKGKVEENRREHGQKKEGK